MKKVLKIKNVLIVATILSMLSCSSDDDSNNGQINNAITVQDFSVTVNENPINGQSLGTVSASSSETLLYSIVSSSPANALSIDANTGELTVADETLYDYETNTVITATVTVENTTEIETINVNIGLEDMAEIGEFKYGGVIFWVNPTGDEGLVCDINNQGFTDWSCSNYVDTGATATAIGTGASNTASIVLNSCTSSNGAANIISALTLNGYDDWFLPSKDELYEIYLNRNIIDATSALQGGSDLENPASPVSLWSSSQSANDINKAWAIQFVNESVNEITKTVVLTSRAVRHWTDF